jgi:hypothetical protein
MTASSSPQGLPIGMLVRGRHARRWELDDDAGPTVGASDAAADAAASGADVDLGPVHRDSDGVPVGEADAEADRLASGARRRAR